MVEVALRLLDERVDLLESLQIPYGRGKEETENHVYIVGEAFTSLLLETHEINHHVGFVIADGDGDISLVDDTQWHGSIRRAASDFLDIRNTEDDEHPAIVVFVAGTLIGIADIRKEIIRDLEFFFQQSLVLVGCTSYLYPAVRLPFIDSLQMILCIPICSHCC